MRDFVAAAAKLARLSGQHALLYAAPPASLVTCFLFALWVGRRVDSRLEQWRDRRPPVRVQSYTEFWLDFLLHFCTSV